MAGAKSRQAGDSSKKDWILRVWREMPNPTTRAVAEVCECDPAYVRVVVRQRKGKGVSDVDKAYRRRFAEANGCSVDAARYRASPQERARHKISYDAYLIRKYGDLKEAYRQIAASRRARLKSAKERV